MYPAVLLGATSRHVLGIGRTCEINNTVNVIRRHHSQDSRSGIAFLALDDAFELDLCAWLVATLDKAMNSDSEMF
jgi:hypothetical protein